MARFGGMIERALVWERTNPYCWMLWADWFRARGMWDAHESTLREMLRLFPHSEHARVELARLLIDRGKETWDEAEHWLQQVMKQNPDSEHARVVTARLLVLRDRPKEAEATLADFVERHSESRTAWSVLNRLWAGLNSAADAFDELRGSGIPAPGNHHDLPERLPRALQELFRRESARTDRWRHLATRFSEAAAETEFLHILAGADEDKQSAAARWRTRYCIDGDTGHRAVDVFMREAHEQLATADPDERGELAFAVMACAAADAPEFVPEWAA